MPIYEYVCDPCGREFELMRPMSQSGDGAPCPTCGTSSPRVPSVFASKENYMVKVPRSPALRAKRPSEPVDPASA